MRSIVVMARTRAELDAAPNEALSASFAGTRSSLGDCIRMNIAIAMLGYWRLPRRWRVALPAAWFF